jgi:uncharacterized protein YecE (DUF72 family)
MNIHVGTSGWSYREWKGSFYPPDLPATDMLRFYASRFSTVEVNNSFYRTPSERVLAGWAEQVPPQFRFVMKASRRITHYSRLANADDSLGYFLRAVTPLGPRMGPTLFQLPPTLEKDLIRLQQFLERLPRRWPAAIEFRHGSWFEPPVYDLLRAYNVALVAVDAEGQAFEVPVVPTASWGYVRLRRADYDRSSLQEWSIRIQEQPWNDAYVFLKHEEGSPKGPGAAELFQHLLA